MREWARTIPYCSTQLTDNYLFHFFYCWKGPGTDLGCLYGNFIFLEPLKFPFRILPFILFYSLLNITRITFNNVFYVPE